MLSEFHELGTQLQIAGIKTESVSPKVSTVPKTTLAVLVHLNQDGTVTKPLDVLSGKIASTRYRKYAKDNMNHLFSNNYNARKGEFKQNIPNCVDAFLDDVGPEQPACISLFCEAMKKVDVQDVCLKVAAALAATDEGRKLLEEIDKNPKKKETNVSVIFELDQADDLYADSTWEWINQQLLGTSASCTAKLPFGTVYLRSMNDDASCNQRYGYAGSESFLAAARMQQTAKSSVEWITDADKKDKTWRWLFDKMILVSYVQGDLVVSEKIELPSYLAGSAVDGEQEEDSFINKSKRLIDAVKLHIKTDNPYFRAMIISPAKKQNASVTTDEFFDFTELNRVIDEWTNGCQNAPAKIGNIPFPLDCLKCVTNIKWHRDGCKLKMVDANVSLSISDIYSLFFLKMSVTTINRLMRTLVWNWRWFANYGISKKYRESFLCFISLLLYRQNIKKETYMDGIPYLLGRYLALADTLHRCYCDAVRNGDNPPSFIGSKYFIAMSTRPIVTFAVMSKAMRVYTAWAKTTNNKGCGLAKWCLKEMGEVCASIAAAGSLPTKFGHNEVAQLMLGFMSKPKNGEAGDDAKKVDNE